MKETWKDIPNYEGFQINEEAIVRRLARTSWHPRGFTMHFPEKMITISKNKKGYMRCELCIEGAKKKPFTIHRLMMLTFVGNPPKGMDQINHKDGNKTNNKLDNLEWSNNSLNIKHAWRTGLFKPVLPKGVLYSRAKPVVHTEYGIYCTLMEAAEICGIRRQLMGEMIAGKIINETKFIRA